MKILCINNFKRDYSLTIGKWYDVEEEEEDGYWIMNNRGNELWYRKSCFKTQHEVREEKLGELGL